MSFKQLSVQKVSNVCILFTQLRPWDTYESSEFQTPWLLSADLLHLHDLSLSRTKYYEDFRQNTDLPRQAAQAVERFQPQHYEDFVHRLDEEWDPSVRVMDGIVTFFQESVFLNLALDQYLCHVIVKVIPAEDIELEILKNLSSDHLRSDPRNHTIPVLQSIPGNGFEFSVQACWYEHWQWPPFDCAASRFEMARQLLEGLVFMYEYFIAHEDIHPRNILWKHAPASYKLSLHSKFSFRMAYIDFGEAVLFSAQNRRSLGSAFCMGRSGTISSTIVRCLCCRRIGNHRKEQCHPTFDANIGDILFVFSVGIRPNASAPRLIP
ncbi:hypothetical protein K438DRAFT_1825530 [Mycena galopus ATCC 62051]|nr:hypothetical protein K438DRAFT_1825530 [Mycena galopus ATCC 62051]